MPNTADTDDVPVAADHRCYVEAYEALRDDTLWLGEHVMIGRFYVLRVTHDEYEVYLDGHAGPIRSIDSSIYTSRSKLVALFDELHEQFGVIMDHPKSAEKLTEWAGPTVVKTANGADIFGEYGIYVKEAPPGFERP